MRSVEPPRTTPKADPTPVRVPPREAVQRSLRGPGAALPAEVRAPFEQRFGHDFSRIRVHADAPADEAARSLGAAAATFGDHLVFRQGRYVPSGPAGRRLLAHELAHAVQQGPQPLPGEGAALPRASRPHEAPEREAEAAADAVAQGLPAPPLSTGAAPVLALQDAGTPAAPAPESPELEARLNDIEARYRAMIQAARDQGRNVAADNLQRFLDGTGGTKVEDWAWLRGFEVVLDAEETNRERFESSLADAADALEHGATREFRDHWDRQFTAPLSEELYYASGTSTIRSTGQFTLSCIEDTIHIGGSVTHLWHDPYDWHANLAAYIPGFGTVSDADALLLEQHRSAKPFQMVSAWRQTLQATVVKGTLWNDKSFTWDAPAAATPGTPPTPKNAAGASGSGGGSDGDSR